MPKLSGYPFDRNQSGKVEGREGMSHVVRGSSLKTGLSESGVPVCSEGALGKRHPDADRRRGNRAREIGRTVPLDEVGAAPRGVPVRIERFRFRNLIELNGG